MNRLTSVSLTLMLSSLAVGSIAPSAKAQAPITFAFTGVITSVDDSLGWFNNTYAVGAPITGSYTFFASGYGEQTSPHSIFYQFEDKPNSSGIPITHPDFRVTAGDREFVSDSHFNPYYYGIRVWNDEVNSFPGVGDGYHVQAPMGFPSFFHDFSGDPIADPDGFFFPINVAGFNLLDPTGTALNSLDLLLTPPDLSVFSGNRGFITIDDGNGEPSYATAHFRVTSITAVPEPGSLALLLGVGIGGVGLLMRRRRKYISQLQRRNGSRKPVLALHVCNQLSAEHLMSLPLSRK